MNDDELRVTLVEAERALEDSCYRLRNDSQWHADSDALALEKVRAVRHELESRESERVIAARQRGVLGILDSKLRIADSGTQL